MAEAEPTMSGRRWRVAAAAMLAAVVGTGAMTAAPASADPSVRVSLGDASGLEHTDTQAGLFIPLTLSRATSSPVTVTYWTESGTATAGTDFVKWGTPNAPRSATIAAGARQTTINVPVKPDGETENNETFTVVLGSVTTVNATIFNGSGQGTIVDSSAGHHVSSVAIVEGDEPGLKAQVRIEFASPYSSRAGVNYETMDDTAFAPADYRAITRQKDRNRPFDPPSSPTLYFEPGQTSKTLDIPITGNETTQDTRGFYVNHPWGLSSVTIIDDDVALVSAAPQVTGVVTTDTGSGFTISINGTGLTSVNTVSINGVVVEVPAHTDSQINLVVGGAWYQYIGATNNMLYVSGPEGDRVVFFDK